MWLFLLGLLLLPVSVSAQTLQCFGNAGMQTCFGPQGYSSMQFGDSRQQSYLDSTGRNGIVFNNSLSPVPGGPVQYNQIPWGVPSDSSRPPLTLPPPQVISPPTYTIIQPWQGR